MMINNSFTDKSPAEIQSCFADRNTEKDLADAYAVSSNMFWWTADNIDDYDEDTPEYRTACAITDAWAALMDVYQSRVFAILIKERIRIPETAQIHVLRSFMEQNGYICHSGWWYPENE